MTLSRKLNDAMLTMTCPQCGHPCIREGSWFKTARTFKCAECGYATQLTYDDKLRIFGMKTFQCLDCDAKLEVAGFPLPEEPGERANCPSCKGVLLPRDGANLLRYRLVSSASPTAAPLAAQQRGRR